MIAKNLINVESIEQAQKILNEYLVLWDVTEHYEALFYYSFLHHDEEVAVYHYQEKRLEIL